MWAMPMLDDFSREELRNARAVCRALLDPLRHLLPGLLDPEACIMDTLNPTVDLLDFDPLDTMRARVVDVRESHGPGSLTPLTARTQLPSLVRPGNTVPPQATSATGERASRAVPPQAASTADRRTHTEPPGPTAADAPGEMAVFPLRSSSRTHAREQHDTSVDRGSAGPASDLARVSAGDNGAGRRENGRVDVQPNTAIDAATLREPRIRPPGDSPPPANISGLTRSVPPDLGISQETAIWLSQLVDASMAIAGEAHVDPDTRTGLMGSSPPLSARRTASWPVPDDDLLARRPSGEFHSEAVSTLNTIARYASQLMTTGTVPRRSADPAVPARTLQTYPATRPVDRSTSRPGDRSTPGLIDEPASPALKHMPSYQASPQLLAELMAELVNEALVEQAQRHGVPLS